MKNVFFPDEEEVNENDLYYVCYMIERVSRQLKQPNLYTANAIGKRGLEEKLSVASVQHSENPESVVRQWIEQYELHSGAFDVTDVNRDLVDNVPTALQMGRVYRRLIVATMQPEENYADAILRVYNNPICHIIDDYNGSAYYEPSYYITRAYYQGNFN
ncbi:MAG: hypothetical protein LBN29_00805 [Mediterranea sp.]|jgi:hypothetical protein|nr:hypothetical protein [Mediterranea sp.]